MANIIRVEHTKDRPFVVLSTAMIRDAKLNLQCKGMMVFLLAKPDDWQVRPESLASELLESKPTVYRVLNKLIEHGYIHREIVDARKEDGTFVRASMYIVFEDRETRQAYVDQGRFAYERWKREGETESQNQNSEPNTEY